MSGLQFIVDFARTLAWPLAVVALVMILRRPIADILRQLAGGLRRLRAGQSDAEFDWVVGQANAELTAAVSAGQAEPAAMPVLLRFGVLAQDDPAAAFPPALAVVEAALRDLLAGSGKLLPVGTGDPTAVARFARDQGLLPESIVRAVDGRSDCATPPRATRRGLPATTRRHSWRWSTRSCLPSPGSGTGTP
jgi:hypothetical protein